MQHFARLAVNIDNTVGAVGFTTRIAPSVYPVTLIKVDESSGEPVRDRNDMCIMCKPGACIQIRCLAFATLHLVVAVVVILWSTRWINSPEETFDAMEFFRCTL